MLDKLKLIDVLLLTVFPQYYTSVFRPVLFTEQAGISSEPPWAEPVWVEPVLLGTIFTGTYQFVLQHRQRPLVAFLPGHLTRRPSARVAPVQSGTLSRSVDAGAGAGAGVGARLAARLQDAAGCHPRAGDSRQVYRGQTHGDELNAGTL